MKSLTLLHTHIHTSAHFWNRVRLTHGLLIYDKTKSNSIGKKLSFQQTVLGQLDIYW